MLSYSTLYASRALFNQGALVFFLQGENRVTGVHARGKPTLRPRKARDRRNCSQWDSNLRLVTNQRGEDHLYTACPPLGGMDGWTDGRMPHTLGSSCISSQEPTNQGSWMPFLSLGGRSC